MQTASLQERVKRCQATMHARTVCEDGDSSMTSSLKKSVSWWGAQNDSVAKLDSLFSGLGLSLLRQGSFDAQQDGGYAATAQTRSPARASAVLSRSMLGERLHHNMDSPNSFSSPKAQDSPARAGRQSDENGTFDALWSRLRAEDKICKHGPVATRLMTCSKTFNRDESGFGMSREEGGISPCRGETLHASLNNIKKSFQENGSHARPRRGPDYPGDPALRDERLLQTSTMQDETMKQRFEVLQTQNEQLANQTQDLLKSMHAYQSENRRLRDDVTQRDEWIQETILQLNTIFSAVNWNELRDGSRRWLHQVMQEVDKQGLRFPAYIDARGAKAFCDEMGSREREARSRLVQQAEKLRAAEMDAKNFRDKFEGSNNELVVTKAEISLLRQQLDQAVLGQKNVAEDLTRSRVHLQSSECKVLELEKQVNFLKSELHKKDMDVHSLNLKLNLCLQKLRQDKSNFETQVDRVCGGLQRVADGLREPCQHPDSQRRRRKWQIREKAKAWERDINTEILVDAQSDENDDTSESVDAYTDHPISHEDGGRDAECAASRRSDRYSSRKIAGSRKVRAMEEDVRKAALLGLSQNMGPENRGRTSRIRYWDELRQEIDPHRVAAHCIEDGADILNKKGQQLQQKEGCVRRGVQWSSKGEYISPTEEMSDGDANLFGKLEPLNLLESHHDHQKNPGSIPIFCAQEPPSTGDVACSHADECSLEEKGDTWDGDGKIRQDRKEGDKLLGDEEVQLEVAACRMASVGMQGAWSNPGVLWEDPSAHAPAVNWTKVHADGKELSGFFLRRALKALGKGFTISLSALEAHVQRQLLLGANCRGVPNCSIISLPVNTTLVQQGQSPKHMLVILRGRVKIWRTQHSSTGSRQAPGDRENDINGKQERSNLSVNEGGDIDAMLTECVGEVTNGGALLEAEAALGLTSPYTAIVAMCSTDAGESGKSGDERESQATHQSCEMLCITGEALSALVNLYPSLNLTQRLVLARKALPYPGRHPPLSDGSLNLRDASKNSCSPNGLEIRTGSNPGSGDEVSRAWLVASDLSDAFYTPAASFNASPDFFAESEWCLGTENDGMKHRRTESAL